MTSHSIGSDDVTIIQQFRRRHKTTDPVTLSLRGRTVVAMVTIVLASVRV